MIQSVKQAGHILWTLHAHDSLQLCSGSVSCSSFERIIKTQIIPVDRYEPVEPYLGILVVFHGMSPMGKSDPRIINLCYALGHVGYRVLAPEIESIKQLTINPNQIESITDIIHTLVNDAELVPMGRVGVLAPSFSGGMCISAASSPKLKERVSAICTIGAFTEVNSVMSYLLNDDSADLYGRFIVLKKIVPLVCEDHELFLDAIDAAIKDNLNDVDFDEFTNAYNCFLSSLSELERKKVRRLFHDADYREQLYNASKELLTNEFNALDVANQIENLSSNVFLLHGVNDRVIPCAQSKMLYLKLKHHKKKVDLVITPFISHGDIHFKFSQVFHVASLLRGFSRFFNQVTNDSTARH